MRCSFSFGFLCVLRPASTYQCHCYQALRGMGERGIDPDVRLPLCIVHTVLVRVSLTCARAGSYTHTACGHIRGNKAQGMAARWVVLVFVDPASQGPETSRMRELGCQEVIGQFYVCIQRSVANGSDLNQWLHNNVAPCRCVSSLFIWSGGQSSLV